MSSEHYDSDLSLPKAETYDVINSGARDSNLRPVDNNNNNNNFRWDLRDQVQYKKLLGLDRK